MLAQVERLSALLLRVQKNRSRGRTAAGGHAETQSAAANEAMDVEISEDDDEIEASKPISSAPPPPPPPARRPEPERRATPLEMAVTGQLEREQQTGPRAAPPAQARSVAARPATTPIAASIEALAPEPISPLIIEPDPPREGTRPIAQVVSKHAPQVDATFGAMLKRSLSLRPH